MLKQTRAVYSSRILLPQFVWTGACIVQSRWHMRASPALGRRRLVSPQEIYHWAFVKGLIKKVGTSWYHHGVISHFWHLRSAIAFTILRQQLFCWYKSTSTRADTAAADVATQCLYMNWSHRAERTCDPLLHYGGMAQFSNSHEICWNIRIGKI